jgi:hypothetical protein
MRMAMFTVLVLAAALAGVSALHPELRLLSDGMRQTVEVARILDAQLDAAKAAMAKCVTALLPPSITSFYTCIGVDLAQVATGNQTATEKAAAAIAKLQAEGASIEKYTTITKESCTALFNTKTIQCAPIMFASNPAAFIKANPFPTSVDKLPAGCADIKTLASQSAEFSADCTNGLTSPEVTGTSAQVATTCGQTADGKDVFAESKKTMATVFNECAKIGVDPSSQLSATDAAAVKAAVSEPTNAPTTNTPTTSKPANAAGLVASVVLAAAAVVVAI